MVNLKEMPYSLSDEDIAWVESTIAGMTAEEELIELAAKYRIMDALVENLMTGPEAFTGIDPIDSFCGLWDTHL